jgi:hypothetical protein
MKLGSERPAAAAHELRRGVHCNNATDFRLSSAMRTKTKKSVPFLKKREKLRPRLRDSSVQSSACLDVAKWLYTSGQKTKLKQSDPTLHSIKALESVKRQTNATGHR